MDADKFDLGFTLAPEDFRAMMRAYWRLSRARRGAVRGLRIVAMIGAALAAFSWWETGEAVDAVLAVVSFSAPFVAPTLNRFYYGNVFRQQRLGAGPMRVKTDPDGVWKSGPNGESRYTWAKVRRVDELKRHVLLWISPYRAVIVPKRAFANPAESRRFVDMARQKSAAGDTF